MFFFFSKFVSDWMALIQSFWFSSESPFWINFFIQNIGFSKIWQADRLISWHFFRSIELIFKNMFSAKCCNPGLLRIFSIFLQGALLVQFYICFLSVWEVVWCILTVPLLFTYCNLKTIDNEILLTFWK